MPGNESSAGFGSTLSLLYFPELRAAAVSTSLKTDPGASWAPVGPLTFWFRLIPGTWLSSLMFALAAASES